MGRWARSPYRIELTGRDPAALLVLTRPIKQERPVLGTAPALFPCVWFSRGLLDVVDGEGVGAVV